MALRLLSYNILAGGEDRLSLLAGVIQHAENHRLPVFAKTVLEIEVLWERTKVSLLATHLKAGQDEEREHYRVAEMQAILSLLRVCKNPNVATTIALWRKEHPALSFQQCISRR